MIHPQHEVSLDDLLWKIPDPHRHVSLEILVYIRVILFLKLSKISLSGKLWAHRLEGHHKVLKTDLKEAMHMKEAENDHWYF